jgi:hypothetical protein
MIKGIFQVGYDGMIGVDFHDPIRAEVLAARFLPLESLASIVG